MTIIQLEYLLAVANCGSFSLAAEHCFVTQPSLSMQIKSLEEELGVVLLDRSKKPVIATEAGEVVLERARETLRAYDNIRESVAELKGEIAGRLRLGVIPTVAPYLLHKFLPGFVHDYPHVELEVKELMTRDIVDAMKHDRIDAALVAGGTCGDGIQEQELFDDRFFIYVSPDNPLYERSNVRIEDIDLRDLILLSDGNCMRDQVIELCQAKRGRAVALLFRVGFARYAHAYRRLHAVRDDHPRNGRRICAQGAPRPRQDIGQRRHVAQDRHRRAAHVRQIFDHQGARRIDPHLPQIGVARGRRSLCRRGLSFCGTVRAPGQSAHSVAVFRRFPIYLLSLHGYSGLLRNIGIWKN